MARQWTRAGILTLLAKQLPYLQRNKRAVTWNGGKGTWYGLQWSGPHGHWARAHVESMHLIATYIAGVRAKEHQGETPDITALETDIEAAVLAATAAHCTDASLRFEHTKGPWGNGWQSAYWAYELLRSVMLASDALSQQAKAATQRVVEFECNRFIGVPPPNRRDL